MLAFTSSVVAFMCLAKKRKEGLIKSLLACESDHESSLCVTKLLLAGVSMRTLLTLTDPNGWTIVQLAALHNHVNTLIILREHARQPMTEARASENSGQQEEFLPTTRLKIFQTACEYEGVCGMTPLLLAIASGHEDLSCFLLNEGVSTNPTGSRCRNCLYLLCRGNLSAALDCVLSYHGAAVVLALAAASDTSGYNALHAAVLAGHVGICESLLSAGCAGDIGRACFCSKSKDDSNVFHLVARLSKVQPCPRTARDMTTALLDHLQKSFPLTHHDVLSRLLLGADCFGSTPLHVAAVTGNSACLQLLLQQSCAEGGGGVPLARDNDGYHPTMIAAAEFARLVSEFREKFPRSVLLEGCPLILSGSMTDCSLKTGAGEGGEIGELQARGRGLAECLQVLLAAGYPLDSVDYSRNTLLHSLAFCPPGRDLSLLLGMVMRQAGVLLAVAPCKPEEEALLHFQRTLAIRNDHGWTCFHVALSQDVDNSSVAASHGPDETSVPDNHKKVSCVLQDQTGKNFFSVLFTYTSAAFQSSFDPSQPKAELDSGIQRAKCGAHRRIPYEDREAILQHDYSIQGVANFLLTLPHQPRIVVIAGAGISTSAGIPDFRSSNGLYTNGATAELFSSDFLHNRTEEFFLQLKELFLPVVDGHHKPTASHALLRVLNDSGWLSRVYTQNIDMLEAVVFRATEDGNGDDMRVMDEKVVECHGSMRRFYCTAPLCAHQLSSRVDLQQHVWGALREDRVPACPLCNSLLRPDVTFFGEPLPERFHQVSLRDLPGCDLLLVLGTSLLVYPVAGLPQLVGPSTVRLLCNREASGCFQFVSPVNSKESAHGPRKLPSGDQCDTRGYRDVFHQGDCDSAARELARLLGRTAELEAVLAAAAL